MQDSERRRLQRKFELGMIDKRTYIYELKKLESKTSFDTFILILFLVLVMLIIFGIDKPNTHREDFNNLQESILNLNNLPEPIQKATVGSAVKMINNEELKINYIAKYTLYGYVVDVQEYFGNSLEEKLSPIDVGMAWGFLSDKSISQKIKFSSSGNRFLKWNTYDSEWLRSVGGWNRIEPFLSNNHLIPCDDNIEKLIKSIKKGDYVKIEGYLVNVRR